MTTNTADDDSIINDEEDLNKNITTGNDVLGKDPVIPVNADDSNDLDKKINDVEDPKKGNSNIKKILSDRNSARLTAKELADENLKLKEELSSFDGVKETVDNLNGKISDLEFIGEVNDYFTSNPEHLESKSEILKVVAETGLPFDRATKLYYSENKPINLLDEQERNKMSSFSNGIDQSVNLGNKNWETMNDTEFREFSNGLANGSH